MLLTTEQMVHLGCIVTICAFLLGIAFLIACDKDADDAEEKEKREKLQFEKYMAEHSRREEILVHDKTWASFDRAPHYDEESFRKDDYP